MDIYTEIDQSTKFEFTYRKMVCRRIVRYALEIRDYRPIYVFLYGCSSCLFACQSATSAVDRAC